MRRRSRASTKPAKARSRKAKTLKVVRHSSSSASRQETEVVRLTHELKEAHEQQAATSEVLEIIGHSTFDLQRVLDSLLEKAVRLCDADRGFIFTHDGDGYRLAANYGHSAEFVEKIAKRYPITLDRGSASGRAILERRVVHIPDILADPEYRWAKDHHGEEEMHRTILAVPMLREDKIVGVIIIRRTRVEPFTEKQIALVSSFATQAVIAIENARLLNELRELLDRQTATAEVLKVISSSPGELTPVFDSVLANATQLCEASHGAMWLREGDTLRNVAFHGTLPEAFYELWHAGSVIRADAGVPVARCIRERALVIVEDLKEDKAYRTGEPLARGAVDLAGMRTLIAVPMLKENDCVGAITIYRRGVKPFAEKQIELVQNFASQAVIAIENTRLLNELRESLQQQTATSDVLRVISNSPGQLLPVFNAMLENATRICDAAFGSMLLVEGDAFRRVAIHNAPPRFAEFHEKMPVVKPQQIHDLKLLLETKRPVHIADAAATDTDSPIVKYAGARTLLIVPMLKEGELIGAIGIYRQEVRPFTDKQIDLVANFAAQAVIAVENTRLLNELRESLQQQT